MSSSNNILKVFENSKFGHLTTILIEGDPWFFAKEAAAILQYIRPSDAVYSLVSTEDKRLLSCAFGHEIGFGIPRRGAMFINESGLYTLIMSSKLPKAKEFKHWVTSEILPSVRKTGMFATPEAVFKMLSDPNSLIRILEEYRDAKIAADKATAALDAAKDKIEFYNAVNASEGSVPMDVMAKLLKQSGKEIGRNRLLAVMRNAGILMKSTDSRNLPRQSYVDRGYLEVVEHDNHSSDGQVNLYHCTYVTGRGQQWLIKNFDEISKAGVGAESTV